MALKNTRHLKALGTKLGVTKGQYYLSLINQHATNECQFTTLHDKSFLFITISKLDQILNVSANLCNLW